MRAEDADGDTLKYNLEESTDASSFAIVESSGQIQTTSVGYDYENKNIYYVIVKADDGKGPGGNRRPTRSPSDDGGPSIGDAKPTFPDASTTRRLKENTEPGLNIGAPVTATVLVSVPLAYALGGADAASFDIDSSTGQLRTKAGVTYDYEVKSSYAVTVTATGSSKASASISVTINLDDVDEKPGTPEAPTVSSPDGSTTTLLATWTAPDLDGTGPERRPAAHRLRRAIPAGHRRCLDRLAAHRHRHHDDDHAACRGHRLSGSGAGAGRNTERLVAAGKRADGQRDRERLG